MRTSKGESSSSTPKSWIAEWRRIGVWALVMAAGLVALRVFVLVTFSVAEPTPYAVALSRARLPAQSFLAFLLGMLIFSTGVREAFGWVLLALVLALDLGALHYEASFGELAGMAALRQLEHLDVLRCSIATQAPWEWLVVEYATIGALAIVSARLLRQSRLTDSLPRVFGPMVAGLSAVTFGVVTVRPSMLGSHLALAAQEPLGYFVRDSLGCQGEDARERAAVHWGPGRCSHRC